jgi:hypothetical protein
LLRHIFLRPKKRCAFFLIGRKKTSYTAGTLSASFNPEKYVIKNIT